ncbi:MAG: translation initiation factor [Paludibacter sp.]|nr:translation initiation factor [Paludibacter sp.]
MKNDWRDKLNEIKSEVPQIAETPPETIIKPAKKRQSEPLRVELDKRKGKTATLVTEFQGMDSELKELAKTLKVKCGAGGSSRDGEILVQGDFRVKIAEILLEMGFKVKKINFK